MELEKKVTVTQAVKKQVERVEETVTYQKVVISEVRGVAHLDGKVALTAVLTPVCEDGKTGKGIIVSVPDAQALAAQKPEVAELLQQVKELIFAVAQKQGMI